MAQDVKVIDVALKYGYETPGKLSKGVPALPRRDTPSAARRTQAKLKYMGPLQINISLKGGNMMDFQIEEAKVR